MALSKINTNQIVDGAVATADIADGLITTAKLADGAVTTAKTTDSNITTAKIADDAITQAKIGADAVGTTELANDVAISTSGDVTTTGNVTVNTALKLRGDTGTLHFRRTTSEADIAKIEYVNGNPSLDIGANGKNVRFTNGGSFAETMRVGTNGNVTIQDGNLVIGTSGHGIDFSIVADSPASGATTNSELLDHYEEGIWTPANTGSNITYTGNDGHYTRVGRLVTASFDIQVASNSSGDGIHMTNLPYQLVGSNQYGGGFIHFENTSFSELQVYGHDATFVSIINGSSTLTGANLSGARILGMLVYFTS